MAIVEPALPPVGVAAARCVTANTTSSLRAWHTWDIFPPSVLVTHTFQTTCAWQDATNAANAASSNSVLVVLISILCVLSNYSYGLTPYSTCASTAHPTINWSTLATVVIRLATKLVPAAVLEPAPAVGPVVRLVLLTAAMMS
jgi:hypothetical protein